MQSRNDHVDRGVSRFFYRYVKVENVQPHHETCLQECETTAFDHSHYDIGIDLEKCHKSYVKMMIGKKM